MFKILIKHHPIKISQIINLLESLAALLLPKMVILMVDIQYLCLPHVTAEKIYNRQPRDKGSSSSSANLAVKTSANHLTSVNLMSHSTQELDNL